MFIKISKCGWVIPFRQCSAKSQLGAMGHSRPHSKLVAVRVLMECLAPVFQRQDGTQSGVQITDCLGVPPVLSCCFPALYCCLSSSLIFQEVTVLMFSWYLSTSEDIILLLILLSCNFVCMGFDLDTFLLPLLHKCISVNLWESGFSNARAPPSVDFRQSLKIQGLAFSSQGSVPPSSHLDLYFLRPPPGGWDCLDLGSGPYWMGDLRQVPCLPYTWFLANKLGMDTASTRYAD